MAAEAAAAATNFRVGEKIDSENLLRAMLLVSRTPLDSKFSWVLLCAIHVTCLRILHCSFSCEDEVVCIFAGFY